jgi:hypothetical protein
MVVLMQSLSDTSPMFVGDASLEIVVSRPVQPVVMSMQYSINTSLMFGDDVSLDLVVSHPIQPTVK